MSLPPVDGWQVWGQLFECVFPLIPVLRLIPLPTFLPESEVPRLGGTQA